MTTHGKSDLHARAKKIHDAQTEKAANASRVSESERALRLLHADARSHLEKLFKVVHALGKKGRPYSDFPWQTDLLESCDVSLGNRYRNEKQAAVFMEHIAEAARRPLKEILQKADFVSVLCDGSTDVSLKEQEACYIRTCVKGEVIVRFIGLQTVKRPNADNILQAIETSIHNYSGLTLDKFYSKLVGFGSDGASVMVGKKAGVATLLRQKKPELQSVHCYAHRLELAYKQAVKCVTYYQKVETIVTSLYTLYHKSAPLRNELEQLYKKHELSCQVPTRSGGVRWIPFMKQSVGICFRNFSIFCEHMGLIQVDSATQNKDQKAKAKGLHLLLCCPNVLKFGHLLWDVLLVLEKLSLKIQETAVTVCDIHRSVSIALTRLNEFKQNSGAKLKEVEDLKVGDNFKGQTMKVSLKDSRNFDDVKQDFLTKVINCLENRFSDENGDILRATGIININSWPQGSDLACFGNDQVQVLAKNFASTLQQAIDVDELDQEWFSLKKAVDEAGRKLTWPAINQKFGHDHSNILKVIDLCHCLPGSSAECERGFSTLKQTKTDWRNKLTADSLTNLMTVNYYSEEISAFNPTEAIDLWWAGSQRARRPQEGLYQRHGLEEEDDPFEGDSSDEEEELRELLE